MSYHSLLVEIYYYLAKYYLLQNEYEQSILHAQKSFEHAKVIDSKEGMACAMQALSEIYETQNRLKDALNYYKKYNDYKEQLYKMKQFKNHSVFRSTIRSREIKKNKRNTKIKKRRSIE